MKAAFLTEPNKIELREVEKPHCGENEIIVKIAYCGICTLEQRLFTGDRKIYYPIVPGHEACGVIEEIGKKVITGHKIGDKVALDLVNRCHICHACLSGNSNMCENRFKKGQKVLGGFSEYMSVRPDQCYILPSDFSLKTASLVEPVACCIRSMKKLDVKLGDDVLIIGAGPMGQIQAKVAKAMGARVFVADIDEKRLDFALKAGCDKVFNARDTEQFIKDVKEATDSHGVNAVAVTTPVEVSLLAATQVITSNGKINVYTSYNDDPKLPFGMNSLHRIEALVTGSEGRTEFDFYQSVRALISSRIVVDDLISEVYPLKEVEKAVGRAMNGGTYRVLLQMEA